MINFLGFIAGLIAAAGGLVGWPDPVSAAMVGAGLALALMHLINHAVGSA